MEKTTEEIKQELENAEFVPYDIEDEDELNYTETKTYFLSTQETIESAIKKVEKALKEATTNYEWLTKMKKDLTEKNEETEYLDKAIANMEKTIENVKATLEENYKRLADVVYINQNCFTETVKDGVAYVQEDGKVFSKYFALVLKGM